MSGLTDPLETYTLGDSFFGLNPDDNEVVTEEDAQTGGLQTEAGKVDFSGMSPRERYEAEMEQERNLGRNNMFRFLQQLSLETRSDIGRLHKGKKSTRQLNDLFIRISNVRIHDQDGDGEPEFEEDDFIHLGETALEDWVSGAMRRAYQVLRARIPHMRDVPMNMLINSEDTYVQFAALTGMEGSIAQSLTGRRRELDNLYERKKQEREQVIHYFKRVHRDGDKLTLTQYFTGVVWQPPLYMQVPGAPWT